MKPVIIGVAGGTGSGKTRLVKEMVKRLGPDITVIQHDSYYRDRSGMSEEERARVNYDHPDALETSLLVAHAQDLLGGQPVEVPVYDFSTHTRSSDVVVVEPHGVILVEGILVLAEPDLRDLMSIRVFVDTDADIRLIRRLKRDLRDRGRTMESVVKQYMDTVRPMHLEFVEPSKRHAHVIIPEGGHNYVAVDMLVARIQDLAHGAAPES